MTTWHVVLNISSICSMMACMFLI